MDAVINITLAAFNIPGTFPGSQFKLGRTGRPGQNFPNLPQWGNKPMTIRSEQTQNMTLGLNKKERHTYTSGFQSMFLFLLSSPKVII